MAFNQQDREKFQSLLDEDTSVGKNPKRVSLTDIIAMQEEKQVQKEAAPSTFFDRAKKRFTRAAERTTENIVDIAKGEQAGEQGRLRSAFQATGSLLSGGAEFVFGTLIDAAVPQFIAEPVKEKTKQILETEAGQKGVQAMIKAAEGPMEVWQEFETNNPAAARDLKALAGFLELYPGSKAARGVIGAGTKVTKEGITGATKLGRKVVGDVADYLSTKDINLGKKAARIIAAEPSKPVITILKETPTQKLDDFVALARKHAEDQRTISGFEKVGEQMSEATKQLKRQLDSIGEQKSIIINKAKTGLSEFKDAPRRAILKVSKLEDNPVNKKIIKELKDIDTKIDADKAIDKIQDMIYTSGRDLTLPQGSRAEKQLKKIIGELNTELKKSLPKSYRRLNDLYSDKIKIVNTLNKALREELEGLPIGGASLIKQFFSPSGTRTKQLFEYIKQNTGIDLAQDATLAKFTGELFDDPNVRSLLQGIPKSTSGVIDATIDFLVEKTNIGEKTRDILREGTIERAKDITR